MEDSSELTTQADSGQKRKIENSPTSNSKMSKKTIVFEEGQLPEDMFHIGKNVFIYPSVYHGEVYTHIRKFTKFGRKHYPSSEGIALHKTWAEIIINRKSVPTCARELPEGYQPNDMEIVSRDFLHFQFRNVRNERNITISKSQWEYLIRNQDSICVTILNCIYETYNFANMLYSECGFTAPKDVPSIIDDIQGQDYLIKLIVDSTLCILKEVGGLKDPFSIAEELWANRDCDFNSAAFKLGFNDVALEFSHRVSESAKHLQQLPIKYISANFLTNIKMNDILEKCHNILCPPDTFEFFDDEERWSAPIML